MPKLDWNHEDRDDYESASYRGLRIEARRDDDAGNPWNEWDGNPPALAKSGRDSLQEYGADADGLNNPLAAIPDGRFRRHWRKIAEAVDMVPSELHAEALQSQKDYGGGLTDIKRELVGEKLEELTPTSYAGNAGDYFEALASLWQIAGREALATSSQGYTQGDYAELLFVATPEWEELTGAPRDSHARQLESAADLWGAWAWGDVYGYVITLPDGGDLGALHDSCWGFYGDSHDKSGLEEQATNAVDCILRSARKSRFERLRELIRNRVPLDRRAQELADAAGELAALFNGGACNA